MFNIIILIMFLLAAIYVAYALSIGFLICFIGRKYSYRFKRYKVLIRVARKSPDFMFPVSIGIFTGALLAFLTASSYGIAVIGLVVMIASFRSSLIAHFSIKKKT